MPAQLDGIDAGRARGVVDGALEEVRRLGPAGAAVGTGRDLVRAGADELDLCGRDPVRAAHQHRGGVRRDGGRGDEVGAEVGPQPGAHGEHRPVGVERQLHLGLHAAALVGGEEVLEPVLGPLHRPVERDRGDRDRGHLRCGRALAAERAADVGHDDPDRVVGTVERVGELRERAVRVLGRAPQGQPVRARVVLGDRAACLDRRGDEPRQRVAAAGHVRGRRERAVDLPYGLRPLDQALRRRPRLHDRVERLVGDVDELDDVLGERARLRDHERDGLPDVAGLAVGEHGMGEVGDGAALRHLDGERPDPAAQVGGGEHGDQPFRAVRDRHRRDPRPRVRTAHERGVRLARPLDVVEVARAAAQDAGVLPARDRRADELAELHRGAGAHDPIDAAASRSAIQSPTSGR